MWLSWLPKPVDSATSRCFGQTCSAGPDRITMWRDRPKDAYAALQYLQRQPFVQADRVGNGPVPLIGTNRVARAAAFSRVLEFLKLRLETN